jgi:Pyruvate/2-oxoacid:ferredoxin oxidoreductase delta subunit
MLKYIEVISKNGESFLNDIRRRKMENKKNNVIASMAEQERECCGCELCSMICPQCSIVMKADEYGFRYPSINYDSCVDCGLCKKKCPVLNNEKTSVGNNVKAVCASITHDRNIWRNSSSGGAFSEICNTIGNDDTIVFGAKWDGFRVKHDYIVGVKNIVPFLKSKYVAGYDETTIKMAKEFLDDGKSVIYSGRPCQIAALKSFLGKDYKNLICIDLACHGVGSPEVFSRWIKWLEKKYKSKILGYSFREKLLSNTRCISQASKYYFEDGSQKTTASDYYWFVYRSGLIMRKSCQNCQFAGHSDSDITLADFKNKYDYLKEHNGHKNVSTLVAHTNKGLDIIERLRANMDIYNCYEEDLRKTNPKLFKSVASNEMRDKFLEDTLKCDNILLLMKKYCYRTIAEWGELYLPHKIFQVLKPLLIILSKIQTKIHKHLL